MNLTIQGTHNMLQCLYSENNGNSLQLCKQTFLEPIYQDGQYIQGLVILDLPSE